MTPCTIKLYALSTCVHCRHTKEFLEELSVPFDCIYVDRLEGEKRKEIIEVVKKHNPKISFPTLVITADGEIVIVGFQRDNIKEALHL